MTAALLPMLASALDYAAQWGPVFPLLPRAKTPHPKLAPHGFKDASADPDVIREWWRECPDANVGVVPGRAGCVVLDIDGDEGADTATSLRVPTTTAWVRTSRGAHVWFTRPDGPPIGNAPLGPGLDVRGDRGYVLLPPSVHPTGHVYRWHQAPGAPVPPIAALPSEVLARLRPDPAAAPVTPSERPHLTLYRGEPVGADVWRRLERYLAKMESGLPADSGRKRAAYRLTCVMVHELDIPDAQAWPVLAAWNSDNQAPLSERELRRVFVDAKRRGRARWEAWVA